MNIKKYYSISEAANLLGKTTDTLRRWDKSGRLEALREPISKYRLYKKEVINNLIKPLFDNLDEDFDNY